MTSDRRDPFTVKQATLADSTMYYTSSIDVGWCRSDELQRHCEQKGNFFWAGCIDSEEEGWQLSGDLPSDVIVPATDGRGYALSLHDRHLNE